MKNLGAILVYVLHFVWAEDHDSSELELSMKICVVYSMIFSLQ